ncbi:hypothetical protein HPB48_003549 [Haemaphysalis longicornis]|uniref:Uncharacterized protein n=1 Tax=Haemaphysalis longicornis TaxID=44386 RepID=A0A9J6FBE8_HAELO|nr:hypothetical protein HPB48_003549 [Haemaphysalis longicornis]
MRHEQAGYPAEIQQIVHSLAEDPKLSKTSNARIVTTCDTKQAARLLRVNTLPLRSRQHLQVTSHQVPASGMPSGSRL